ncbi:MAG TPA: YiiX/YebB-like N1pC/P60 family cysteine hydrolase [Gammaproteobacteria bacterium]|jgi:hypothetical protein|nr:YiiX/YebB-like N1pC/P60 family cysteine hydrolase [Gammaproteobacteria bacterium]
MFKSIVSNTRSKLDSWLSYEPPATGIMPYDFSRLKYEIRPGDVLLIEGRSRISRVIRTITQSPWTHAALYIGRLIDFEDDYVKETLRAHTNAKENTRLIIEDLIDRGTVVTPLSFYRHHHIRICRPIGITPSDLHQVLNYAIRTLGQPYNVRQLLDLARFLLPWTILPRRWGSTLFRTSTGEPESGICSSLIAEAFNSVHFPILPFIKADEHKNVEVLVRNPYLYTPKDFDFSPYFEIIKYPLFNPDEPLPYYRRMPWAKDGTMHHDGGVFSVPGMKLKKKNKKSDNSKNGIIEDHKSHSDGQKTPSDSSNDEG